MVVVVRFQFNKGFEKFKTGVVKYQTEQRSLLDSAKNDQLKLLRKGNSKILKLFESQFTDSNAVTSVDTTFHYFYLSGSVSYQTPKPNFIECLLYKCGMDYQNEATQKQIEKKALSLEKMYGEAFISWYPHFKDSILLKRIDTAGQCANAFNRITLLSYDQPTWKEFEHFLAIYNSDKRKVEIDNTKQMNEFNQLLNYTRSKLFQGGLNYFDRKIDGSRDQLVMNDSITKTFNSTLLGSVTYKFKSIVLDKAAFEEVSNEAFKEQWSTNSLRNGSMPYYSCYGSNNYCESYCSQISVKNGGLDVLVTIKNDDGRVIRHGYIRSGMSYTFNVSNGSYQVFFYSGKGWNPYKQIDSNTCGSLSGSFVSDESVSKDSYIDLYSQVMSYSLVLTQNGNFSTKPSSKSEAF